VDGFLNSAVPYGHFEVRLSPTERGPAEGEAEFRRREAFRDRYAAFIREAGVAASSESELRQMLADVQTKLAEARSKAKFLDPDLEVGRQRMIETSLRSIMESTYARKLTSRQREILASRPEYAILRMPEGLGALPFVVDERR
jgi:hypothetical protein